MLIVLDIIPIGSDVNITAKRARWVRTGEPANGLTMSYTLKDAEGVAVSGAEDVPMPLETETGDYVGPMTAAITGTLTDKAQYTLVETATIDIEVEVSEAYPEGIKTITRIKQRPFVALIQD